MPNLFCPPFQSLANAVHFREPDKTVEVWRISTKPEASYGAEAFHVKCWALARKVYKLLTSLLTESTVLFREVTCYIMMIVSVVMASKGLQNSTESETIQAGCGIAQTWARAYTRVRHPCVLHTLCTGVRGMLLVKSTGYGVHCQRCAGVWGTLLLATAVLF